jgi:hypothetical protein
MGVSRRVDAGEQQLDAGLQFLRLELAKLAGAYPGEAARLRIPGSVEAIQSRLAVATGGVAQLEATNTHFVGAPRLSRRSRSNVGSGD